MKRAEAEHGGHTSGGESGDELSTRRIELRTVAQRYQDAFEHVSNGFRQRGGGKKDSVSNCRSFKLRVRAHEDKSDGPEVNIWMSLLPEYPRTPQSLELDVEAVGGVSEQQVKELQANLRNLVRNLVGKEMVFDLAKAAQEFLDKAMSNGSVQQERKQPGEASPTRTSEKPKNGNGAQQEGMKQSSLFFRQQQLMSQRFRWKRVMTYRMSEDGKTMMAPEVLGIGRFGTVYMAMAEFNTPGALPHAGSVFAIKEFTLRKDAMRQGQVDKIVAEVECQRKLNHKNIVEVYGAEMDTGIFRIFLEYMPMGSVAALLRMMGPLDEDVVRPFTQQLLCGVAFMHSNGVVHRDIKPANLLLGINGVLKVSDFGEAKWLPNVVKDAEHAMLQSMHGTTRYMAPEVIKRQYTIAADVWSIGCTVLEMLTGVMPYSSLSNDMAVARCVLRNEEPPLIPSGLSEECHRFLLRCFTRDPDQRPSASELMTDPFVSGSVGVDYPMSHPSENSSHSQSMSPLQLASDADSGGRAGSSEKSSEEKSSEEKSSNRSHNSLCNSPQPMSNVSEESGEHTLDNFGNFGLSVSSRYKQEFETGRTRSKRTWTWTREGLPRSEACSGAGMILRVSDG
mmetsp:Transcript_20287/g.67674  ORF Transcript_20287/g.67674 Transcript_20287/m.67674 type:complete len:619 (-) Transcript_20287:761-2617(-)